LDVIRALNRWGAYQGNPSSIKSKRQVQEIFNALAEQSGRPLCQLSRILALSVNE
ncbi:MAG: DNA-3-methyladenine glycosylase I, partial [Gammaproteobacteria bacterium]|nr:DNA-3-methyladenine glycosylase I [Gammaproteobacteria bacterium]